MSNPLRSTELEFKTRHEEELFLDALEKYSVLKDCPLSHLNSVFAHYSPSFTEQAQEGVLGTLIVLPKYNAQGETRAVRQPSNRNTNRLRTVPPQKATLPFSVAEFLEGNSTRDYQSIFEKACKVQSLVSNMMIAEMEPYQGECDVKISMTDQLYSLGDKEFVQVFNITPSVDPNSIKENGSDQFVVADKSGSMGTQMKDGNRFQNLQKAICDKIDHMVPRDRIQVTLFSDQNQENILLPLMALPTPEDKEYAKSVVMNCSCKGLTFMANSLKATAVALNESDRKSKGSRGRLVHVISDGAVHDESKPNDPRFHAVLRNMARTDFTLCSIGIGVDPIAEQGLVSLATAFGGKYVDVERSGTSISEELNNVKPSVTVIETNNSQLQYEGENVEVRDIYCESDVAPKISHDRSGAYVSGIGLKPCTNEKTRSFFVRFRVRDLNKPLNVRFNFDGTHLFNRGKIKRVFSTTLNLDKVKYTPASEFPAIVHYANCLKVIADVVKTVHKIGITISEEELTALVIKLKETIKHLNTYPFASSVAKIIDLLQTYRDQNIERWNATQAGIDRKIEAADKEREQEVVKYEKELKSFEEKLAADLKTLAEKNRIEEIEQIDKQIDAFINTMSCETAFALKVKEDRKLFEQWLHADDKILEGLLKGYSEALVITIKEKLKLCKLGIAEKQKKKQDLLEKNKAKIHGYETAKTDIIQLHCVMRDSLKDQIRRLNDDNYLFNFIVKVRARLQRIFLNNQVERFSDLKRGIKFATVRYFQPGHQSIQEQAVFDRVIKLAYERNVFRPGIFRDDAELIYSKPELSENSYLTSVLRNKLSKGANCLSTLPNVLTRYIAYLATPIQMTLRSTTVSPAIPAWDAMLFHQLKDGSIKVTDVSLSGLYTVRVDNFVKSVAKGNNFKAENRIYLTDADAGGRTGEVCLDDLIGEDPQYKALLAKQADEQRKKTVLSKQYLTTTTTTTTTLVRKQ